ADATRSGGRGGRAPRGGGRPDGPSPGPAPGRQAAGPSSPRLGRPWWLVVGGLTAAHRPVPPPARIAVLYCLASVLVCLAPDQAQLDLGLAPLEVKHERDNGITPFAHLRPPAVQLGAVQQELAGADRVMGEGRGSRVRGDPQGVKVELPPAGLS